MFDRNPATRRKADLLDTPGKRPRLITKQSPETVAEHATTVKQAEPQAIEDRGFASELLLGVKPDVITHANEQDSWGSGTCFVAL